MNIHHLRRNYTYGSLVRNDLPIEPMLLFNEWFAQLQSANLPDWFEINAMTIATCEPNGGVSSRIVLLKHLEADGFHFFTNYNSEKGRCIAANPRVALHFFWPIFDRQVRIEGIAEKSSAELSDTYFHSRPRASQLGALASPQSEVIDDESALESLIHDLEKRYEGSVVPRPANWGGYKVVPNTFEFWQGKPSRLHDRFRYRLEEGNQWRIERLAP